MFKDLNKIAYCALIFLTIAGCHKRNSIVGDVDAPVVLNISTSVSVVPPEYFTYQCVITWDTDELSTSQVEYGLDTNYGLSSAEDTTGTIHHSVTISDLQLNSTYHYRIKSKDDSGNLIVSADKTFLTPETYYTEISGMNLAVTLSGNEYNSGDEISCQVTLSNISDSTIKISELSVAKSSINILLRTPEGYVLYIEGARLAMLPDAVELSPGNNISADYKLTDFSWTNGSGISSYKIGSTGQYAARVVYYPYFWEGRYDSICTGKNFSIIE